MRLLRELADELTAQRLVDALSDQGIETELKHSGETHAVWVIDEAHLKRAGELSSAWLDDGQRDAFEQSAGRGLRARELTRRIEERRQRHIEAMAHKLQTLARPRPTPLTWGLLALSLGVAVLTELGSEESMVARLLIADPRRDTGVTFLSLLGSTLPWLHLPLAEPWRLITPIFVHFHPLHIFFNLLWLSDLGRTVESNHGTRYLAVFVILCAVFSNVAQYELGQRPHFGGLSGVVYGLLGAVWMRGRLDPWVGYRLSRATVQFMVIWLAFGFFPQFGVANWCHTFGLLFGIAWAFVAHRIARARG